MNLMLAKVSHYTVHLLLVQILLTCKIQFLFTPIVEIIAVIAVIGVIILLVVMITVIIALCYCYKYKKFCWRQLVQHEEMEIPGNSISWFKFNSFHCCFSPLNCVIPELA